MNEKEQLKEEIKQQIERLKQDIITKEMLALNLLEKLQTSDEEEYE